MNRREMPSTQSIPLLVVLLAAYLLACLAAWRFGGLPLP